MDIETWDVVTVPTYSMVSLVKYPVYNLLFTDTQIFGTRSSQKIFIRYAFGTEPRVSPSKIMEVKERIILIIIKNFRIMKPYKRLIILMLSTV